MAHLSNIARNALLLVQTRFRFVTVKINPNSKIETLELLHTISLPVYHDANLFLLRDKL
jgi:hypothetical protein